MEQWGAVRSRLRSEVGEAAFRSWLKPLTLAGSRKGVVRLAVPTRFMRDWVQSNYAERILSLWRDEVDDVAGIEVVVQPPARPTPKQPAEDTKATEEPAARPPRTRSAYSPGQESGPRGAKPGNRQGNGPAAGGESGGGESDEGLFSGQAEANPNCAQLDPRFTFDNFVVGKPNELAYAAARRVAEAEKVPFNPLFLYGSVGLGKTHLMNAIAWQIRKSTPDRRIIYMSAEKFMFQFVRALRTKDTVAFKEQFRSVDVLMIDDVQFIGGREATQEEFFHTFNALVDQNRQVVISADKSPSDLEGVEERMRSRLGWGLVADIHPTTYELRLGILQTKAEQIRRRDPG